MDLLDFAFNETEKSTIKVAGIGGGGGNAVNHMYKLGIVNVEFMICNTDSQALSKSLVPTKIQLGPTLTEGKGAGNQPEIGKQAAIESLDDVLAELEGTKMLFVTAGMGGGTGTGAAPIIAKAARDMGILTIGIVTIPFRFEGEIRLKSAMKGLEEMHNSVDAMVIIDNDRIKSIYGNLALGQAFAKADGVLSTAAKGIAEIITVHGYVNVDFADVKTVMQNSGVAVMGSAMANGENRAIKAIEEALNSPLLNNNDIRGAKNILLNITSDTEEVTMDEITSITNYIRKKAGNTNIIWGNGYDQSLEDNLNITIIAAGFQQKSINEILGQEKEVQKTIIDFTEETVENTENQLIQNVEEIPEEVILEDIPADETELHNESSTDIPLLDYSAEAVEEKQTNKTEQHISNKITETDQEEISNKKENAVQLSIFDEDDVEKIPVSEVRARKINLAKIKKEKKTFLKKMADKVSNAVQYVIDFEDEEESNTEKPE